MPNIASNIDFFHILSPWDWVVFTAVLAATVAAVLWGHRAKDDSSVLHFMLMGRRLTLPLFVATLVATWYGGIFGVTQIAFESGIYNFLIQGVFWYITYIIFAFVLIRKLRRYPYKTLPEVVRFNVGPKSAMIAGFFNIANVLPIAYVTSLGLFINMFFDIPFVWGMIIGTAFILLYSFFGGFRAIVFSDLVQFTVMVSAVLLVLIFSLTHFGGLSFLSARLPPAHFELFGAEPLAITFVWGFIALSTLVDPRFYQRCFAADSPRTAKIGILISIGIWVVFDICTTGGALYARALIPDAPSNQAYLIYALQLLPVGLKGFFIAGILATILSTLDSCIFIASNTLAYDLMPKVGRNPVRWHRISILIMCVATIALGAAFEGNIRMIWRTMGSYSAACLLFPMLITFIFPRKISDNQFLTSVLAGTIFVTYHRLVQPIIPGIDAFYMGLAATALTLIAWHFINRALTKRQP